MTCGLQGWGGHGHPCPNTSNAMLCLPGWGWGDASRADGVLQESWGCSERVMGSPGNPSRKGEEQRGCSAAETAACTCSRRCQRKVVQESQQVIQPAPRGWENLLKKLSNSLKESGKLQQLIAQASTGLPALGSSEGWRGHPPCTCPSLPCLPGRTCFSEVGNGVSMARDV